MKKQRKRIIPTVGRIWGYIGVALALGTSLAGNVQSSRLHTPLVDPSWTEYAFSALPPLVAFVGIELVNHNPWGHIWWGKYITRVLLFVVVPGSALVSFAHLTLVGLDASTVTMPDQMLTYLNIATAVLTSLLVDGMILGGTGALLLPSTKVDEDGKVKLAEEPAAPIEMLSIEAYPDWRGEMERMLADFNPLPPTNLEPLISKIAELTRLVESRPSHARRTPVVKAALAKQETQEDKEKSRWPTGTHPLWKAWLAARGTKDAWDAERYVLEAKKHMDQDMKHTAAASRLNRWEKAVKADPSLLA
jgi:hypothetical protein